MFVFRYKKKWFHALKNQVKRHQKSIQNQRKTDAGKRHAKRMENDAKMEPKWEPKSIQNQKNAEKRHAKN